jgi:hypothetical protein
MTEKFDLDKVPNRVLDMAERMYAIPLTPKEKEELKKARGGNEVK